MPALPIPAQELWSEDGIKKPPISNQAHNPALSLTPPGHQSEPSDAAMHATLIKF